MPVLAYGVAKVDGPPTAAFLEINRRHFDTQLCGDWWRAYYQAPKSCFARAHDPITRAGVVITRKVPLRAFLILRTPSKPPVRLGKVAPLHPL